MPKKSKKPETPVPAPTTESIAAPAAPTEAALAPTDEPLVEDDGEMVTREERDARQKIRRELAASKKPKQPSLATEAEIEAALDRVEPGWRKRKAAEKDVEKNARAEKCAATKAVRPAAKTTRPEHSNTETPTPTAEDKNAPAADRTMARLQVRWCAALERAGKTPATVAGYRAALQVACNHFGDSTPVASLSARKVQNYNDSDAVTKKRSGKAAAKAGVEKTRRALRLALAWAALAGWIEQATEAA